jgi:hypothetical protein
MTNALQANVKGGVTEVELTLSGVSSAYADQLRQHLQALQDEKTLRSFRLWQLFPGERVQLVGMTREHRPNPFRVRHVSEAGMFYGRKREIQTIVDYILNGASFIIMRGHMRIGKTSLMHHLASFVLPETCPHVLPVVFNAQNAAPITAVTFVENILAAARSEVEPLLRRQAEREQLWAIEDKIEDGPLDAFVAWVKAAEQFTGRRLYLLIDEFTVMNEAYDEGRVDASFFRRMHAIMDRGDVAMLLVIHDHVLRDLGDRLLNASQRAEVIAIRQLDPDAARALITEPLQEVFTLADGVEDHIMRLTNAHPFFVHILCSQLFQQMQNQDSNYITSDVLDFAVVSALDSAFHWFSSYRGADDGLRIIILNTVAMLCGTKNEAWAPIDEIQKHVSQHQAQLDLEVKPIDVYASLDDLYNRGILVRRRVDPLKVDYKIAVGLMHIWLLQGTRKTPSYLE